MTPNRWKHSMIPMLANMCSSCRAAAATHGRSYIRSNTRSFDNAQIALLHLIRYGIVLNDHEGDCLTGRGASFCDAGAWDELEEG
ncbi:hypothetical protein GQ607_000884 [Colletotrichum asianum]|uniref:Uncharacterized protein n=1 Tax=Colletotrichum asianum TaxID=702518 RepID=A0A8H3ZTA0_9PEZI|nr:hypothetical protein GQ607_000884 [Colletotrichum asianum]